MPRPRNSSYPLELVEDLQVGLDADTLTAPTTFTMTAANGGTINSGDATTDAVITANRTRIAELVADVAELRLLVIELQAVALAQGATATP
jgi:hypothetical protein